MVDNNSTDRTRQIAEDLGAIVVEEKTQNLSAARNRGISVCRSDWIALLDADDLWKKKKIEYQWKAIESCPDAKIVFCDFKLFHNETGLKVGIKRRLDKRAGGTDGMVIGEHCSYFPHINAVLLHQLGFLPSTAVIHRNIFSSVGFFDETMSCQGDVEFFMRAVARFPLAVVRKQLAYYRRHDANMTGNIKEIEQSLKRLTERMLRFPDNYAAGAGQLCLANLKRFFVAGAQAQAHQKRLSALL